MQIASTTGANSTSLASDQTARPTGPSTGPAADYNAFLKLLLAQMKNQDPTKPLDPTQMVTQLATFSGVEQAVRTNALLGAMLNNSAALQAGSLIGKTIALADGSASGVVKSVSITSTGMVATLDSERTVPLSSEMSISSS